MRRCTRDYYRCTELGCIHPEGGVLVKVGVEEVVWGDLEEVVWGSWQASNWGRRSRQLSYYSFLLPAKLTLGGCVHLKWFARTKVQLFKSTKSGKSL